MDSQAQANVKLLLWKRRAEKAEDEIRTLLAKLEDFTSKVNSEEHSYEALLEQNCALLTEADQLRIENNKLRDKIRSFGSERHDFSRLGFPDAALLRESAAKISRRLSKKADRLEAAELLLSVARILEALKAAARMPAQRLLPPVPLNGADHSYTASPEAKQK
jgi:chromosome segregation ATPase